VGIEVRVSLVDLKRAFRRLLARLPDESPSSGDLIDFNASEKTLEIVVGGTFEVLNATVVRPGQASVPCAVFRGIARTLRFYRGKFITIAFSAGALRIDSTGYRHSSISTLTPVATFLREPGPNRAPESTPMSNLESSQK
jgi:hypothetical protein